MQQMVLPALADQPATQPVSSVLQSCTHWDGVDEVSQMIHSTVCPFDWTCNRPGATAKIDESQLVLYHGP